MLTYLLLITTLLLATTSLIVLWRGTRRRRWSQVVFGVSFSTFVYLYGTWVYLSIYTKYEFGIGILITLLVPLLKKKVIRSRTDVSAFHLFLSAAFMAMSILFFTGTTGKPRTVELQFPLKKGNYFILQGGKGLPANFFHYSYRGAIYAIDIVRLDNYGRRANKIFSPRLNDYYIFADTLYSPCEGIVRHTTQDNPDNIPPTRTHGNLNSVLIETDAFYVFLGHLKQYSVFVQEGDSVKAGQPIALVGNSGFTLEPHLHIQAHVNSHSNKPWYKEEPLYISFDGRTYLLFETIRPKKVEMVE